MNKSSLTILALSALVAGALLSWLVVRGQPIELESARWFGKQARALPAFELVDHEGRRLDRERLTGNWSLMFFGYTHCPDICPMSLQTLSGMMREIDDPDVSGAIRVYFVSVDPERDNADILRQYVSYFDPRFVGASAPLDQLRTLTRALGIAHDIGDRGESGSYDVDHSAAIVLINPEAEFAGLFSAPQDAAAMARDMTRIIEHN